MAFSSTGKGLGGYVSNVKETQEALVGLMELCVELCKVFKDGVQATDAVALYANIAANKELEAKFVEAYVGIENVPEEIKNISGSDAVKLTVLFFSYLPKFLGAIGKDK